MKNILTSLVLAGALCAPGLAQAQIVRSGAPTANASRSVLVPAGAQTLYLSGVVATPVDPARPTEFGDTKAQLINIFEQIDETLKAQGFSLGDIVLMKVYLANDPSKGGQFDRDAWLEVLHMYFGTKAQPNKPAAVVLPVPALVRPSFLAEVEVQAARVTPK